MMSIVIALLFKAGVVMLRIALSDLKELFSEVGVTRSLVLCVCFVERCLSLCTISFDHCVVCYS